MQQAEKLNLDQIRAFLEASEEVQCEGEKREGIYDWIIGVASGGSVFCDCEGCGWEFVICAGRMDVVQAV